METRVMELHGHRLEQATTVRKRYQEQEGSGRKRHAAAVWSEPTRATAESPCLNLSSCLQYHPSRHLRLTRPPSHRVTTSVDDGPQQVRHHDAFRSSTPHAHPRTTTEKARCEWRSCCSVDGRLRLATVAQFHSLRLGVNPRDASRHGASSTDAAKALYPVTSRFPKSKEMGTAAAGRVDARWRRSIFISALTALLLPRSPKQLERLSRLAILKPQVRQCFHSFDPSRLLRPHPNCKEPVCPVHPRSPSTSPPPEVDVDVNTAEGDHDWRTVSSSVFSGGPWRQQEPPRCCSSVSARPAAGFPCPRFIADYNTPPRHVPQPSFRFHFTSYA